MKKILSLLFIMVLALQIHAQWVQCNGPFGGAINAIAAHDSSIFAVSRIGCYGGSVLLSTNSGKYWRQLGSGLENQMAVDITITADGSYIFALCASGVFYSRDNAESWTNIGPQIPGLNWMKSLAVYSNDSGGTNVLVGTLYNGIFLSKDLGKSWEQPDTSFKPELSSICVIGSRIFVCTYEDRLYISSDNGKSWKPTVSSPKDSYGNIIPMWRIIPGTDSTTLFACTHYAGVFISKDNGESWTTSNSGLANKWVNCLTAAGKNLFAGTDNGVYKSTNNGTSWQHAGLKGINIGAFAFQSSGDPSIKNLFAGDNLDRGMFLSTNMGESWTEVNQGIKNSYIHTLAVYEDKAGFTRLFAGVSGTRISRSTDNGESWTKADSGLPPNSAINSVAYNNGEIFARTDSGLFISYDYGDSWSDIGSSLPAGSYDNNVFASSDATGIMNIFAGTVKGLFRSADIGKSWIEVNSGLPISEENHTSAIAQTGPYILIGFWSYKYDGNYQRYGGLFRSSDNGENWVKLSQGLPENFSVRDIAIIETNIIAGTDNGIFLSTDNGTSWNNIIPIFPEVIYPHSFAVNKSNLFALSQNGVYFTADNGLNWKEISQGLPEFIIKQEQPVTITLMCLASSNTHLFLGIFGHGVWRLPLSGMESGVQSPPDVPLKFSLEQNYPNPFNPSTTIKFTLPYPQHVTLKIFDLLGREVATLVNEVKAEGIHNVTWKAENVSSGIYFYELRAGSTINIRKMMLLR
ncbi:MAG: T9SS type A sorting domain-containing protein [Syntrophomonadaceae bacterium]